MQWFCMNRDLDRLDDILAAASDVMEFCATLDRESFGSQKAVRYAVLHSLQRVSVPIQFNPTQALHPNS